MLIVESFKKVTIREFVSGEELLEAVRQGYQPEITLLDVAMEGMSGLETAEKLRKQADTIIIFVTAVQGKVFKAFDVGAFHYILKPIQKDKFIDVMNRAVVEVNRKREAAKHMLIKITGGYRRLEVDDVLYVESEGRKVIFHTTKDVLETYGKMDEMEKRLGIGFYRCHRSYLVSLSHIKGYDNTSITLESGEQIYLAKRKYSDFVQAYCNYLQE